MWSSEKFKTYVLFLLAVAHILISLFTVIPGYLAIDEVTYHLMVKNFSATGGLEIWNGYQEYPSRELESAVITARNGRLVASPSTYLFTILCTPFYRIGGFHGMFFINVLAFLGVVILCYATTQKLFRDRNLALNASFILVLATFSWEYSQSVWNQITATFFLILTFYLYLCAVCAKITRAALTLTLLSGLIIGFAMGIRRDFILVLLGFVLFLLFQKPRHLWLVLVMCIGTFPGLSVLSAVNQAKFGVFFPLYIKEKSVVEFISGLSAVKPYLSFVGLGILVVASVWVLTRKPVSAGLHRYKKSAIIAAIGLICVLILIPQIRNTVEKRLNGVYQLMIDFRVRDRNINEPALSRTQGGGMVYIGGLKKSLLQSCPYLVVILLPLLRIIRRHREYDHLLLLFLIPIIFTSFYSYHALHGGLALNLRLFVQILPFTSILSAYAWRELTGTLHWSWTRMSVVMLLLSVFTIAYFFFLRPPFRAIDQQEFFYLTEPLLLALFLVILLIVHEKMTQSYRYVLSCAAVATFLIAMIWSGLVAFFYDYPLVRRIRQYNVDVASRTAKFVSDDSILFATFVDPFFLLIEHGRIRIANPANDNFHDFPALIEFHLNAGHAVYGAFDPQQWNALRKRGLLEPRKFDIVPLELFPHCILGQIIAKSGFSSGSIPRVSAQVFMGQTDIGSSHTFLFLRNRSFGNY